MNTTTSTGLNPTIIARSIMAAYGWVNNRTPWAAHWVDHFDGTDFIFQRRRITKRPVETGV